MYYNRSGSNVRGQSHSVKTTDHKIIARFQKIAESNGDVRILIGSRAISVYAHALYTTDQKQPTTTGATSRGLQVAMHL